MTPTAVTAADGCRLAATVFAPAGTSRALVVVSPAMGVVQRYYQPFALWLAQQGFTVVAFDNRGIGQSASASSATCRPA